MNLQSNITNERSKDTHKLRGFDYRVIDQSASDIVDTAKRTGARVAGLFQCQPESELR